MRILCRLLKREEDYRKYTRKRARVTISEKEKKLASSAVPSFLKRAMTYTSERIRFGPAIKGIRNKKRVQIEREVKKIPGKGKCAQAKKNQN